MISLLFASVFVGWSRSQVHHRHSFKPLPNWNTNHSKSLENEKRNDQIIDRSNSEIVLEVHHESRDEHSSDEQNTNRKPEAWCRKPIADSLNLFTSRINSCHRVQQLPVLGTESLRDHSERSRFDLDVSLLPFDQQFKTKASGLFCCFNDGCLKELFLGVRHFPKLQTVDFQKQQSSIGA